MSPATPEQIAAKAAELLKAAQRVDAAFVTLRRALKRRSAREAELLALHPVRALQPRDATRAGYLHRLGPLLDLAPMSQRRARTMAAEQALTLARLPVPAPAPSIATTTNAEPADAEFPEVAA